MISTPVESATATQRNLTASARKVDVLITLQSCATGKIFLNVVSRTARTHMIASIPAGKAARVQAHYLTTTGSVCPCATKMCATSMTIGWLSASHFSSFYFSDMPIIFARFISTYQF